MEWERMKNKLVLNRENNIKEIQRKKNSKISKGI